MSLLVWLAVGVAGGVGALARFLLDGLIGERVGGAFPLGTFAVNLSGALALGVLAGSALHGDAGVVAAGGLVGSYTTFSTWMLETDRSVEDGQVPIAVLNIALSLALGLGAAEVGRLIGGAW